MDAESLVEIRLRCRRYLDSIAMLLYGGKVVDFDFAEAYWDFDSMLKREMAFFKVIAVERMAIGRLERKGDSLELSVFHGLPSEASAAHPNRDSIQAFMIDRGFLERTENGKYRLKSPGLTGDFYMGTVRPGEFVLRGQPSLAAASEWGPDPLEPERIVRAMVVWFKGVLSAWLSGEPEGRVFHVDEDPALPVGMVAGRAISRVDMDSSQEDPAHVFRWKELSKGSVNAYQSLGIEECVEILNDQGVKIPGNAKLAGITRFEQPDGGDCLSVRFLHQIPDPDRQPSARMPNAAWRHQGLIVVEGDYLEYLIDVTTRSLIGMEKKWRPTSIGPAG